MAEEPEGNSTAVEKYFGDVIEVMRENEEFLRKNVKETYEMVIGLVNDAIDNVTLTVKKPESKKNYVERSMVFFIIHIHMPFSYAIHLNLLTGNLPACFIELRLMLESLVKCYLADLKYPNQTFFQNKLKLLEQEPLSTSELMKLLGRRFGVKNDFVALWGKLSNDWVHTKGVTEKVVSHIIRKSDMPPWAIIIPMSFGEDDLDTINELGKRISQFRSLLKVTMEKY